MVPFNLSSYTPRNADPFPANRTDIGPPPIHGQPATTGADIGDSGDSKALKRPSDAAIYRGNSNRFFAKGVDTLFNTDKKLPASGILSDEAATNLLETLKQKSDTTSFAQAASAALTDAQYRRGCDPRTKEWIGDIQNGKLDFRNISMLQTLIPKNSLLYGVIVWLKDKSPEEKRLLGKAVVDLNLQQKHPSRMSKL